MTQSESFNESAAPPVPTPTWSNSLETYRCARLASLKKSLPQAALELKAAGVVFVHVHYDGCGDSGQIESIEYFGIESAPVNPTGKVTLTQDQLMDLFYDLIEIRHAGWENDDGACGEFEWALDSDMFRHVHNERFTDYDTTEHEGL